MGAVHSAGGYSLLFSGSQIAALKNHRQETQDGIKPYVLPFQVVELD
jgi:hypothetical protein